MFLPLSPRPSEPVFETEHGMLYQGDCLDVLQEVESDTIDLVFADPPFNLNKDYGEGINDKMSEEEYLAWCRAWVEEVVRVTKPGGSVWLYNIPRWNVYIAGFMNDLGMTFRHWVTVDIKMSLPIKGKLYPAHYSLLYYCKGKKPSRFERPRVPIEVCRHCGGDIKDYGGHRDKLNPDGINVSDVWHDIPPVRHAKTKTRGANQLSEKLLERVLTISSQEGDLVLDPFGGSGTTYVVAEKMHRHWIGMEIGDVQPIISRLKGEDTAVEFPKRGDSGKGARGRSSAH